MSRGAAVEGMRGVSVPERVRGDVLFDAGIAGGLAYDPPQLTAAERPVGLLRAKHRITWRPEARTHFLVAERDKHIPRRGGKEHGARLLALPLKGDLAGDLTLRDAALLQGAPVEVRNFRYAAAAHAGEAGEGVLHFLPAIVGLIHS